jgi:predicted Fe-Mo cluster-binding NifX family protein
VVIDACFGRAQSFLIYALAGKDGARSYELLETRPGPKPCRDRSHDQDILGRAAGLLSDCGMVLAGRIGPAAAKALADRGVMGLAVPLGIDEALRRLAKN